MIFVAQNNPGLSPTQELKSIDPTLDEKLTELKKRFSNCISEHPEKIKEQEDWSLFQRFSSIFIQLFVALNITDNGLKEKYAEHFFGDKLVLNSLWKYSEYVVLQPKINKMYLDKEKKYIYLFIYRY